MTNASTTLESVMTIPRPLALLAELTYRCPLKCPYCSNPLEMRRYANELDTDTWIRVLQEAAELGVVQVHFSGGEPMIRTDLCKLIRSARSFDLYSTLSTGATQATPEALDHLQAAGLDTLQVSLQDTRQTSNDWLAGTPSFEKKEQAVKYAKQIGFPVTLNIVLHRHNIEHIDEAIRLAEEWNVEKIELAHTQYLGWAFRNRAALLPAREQLDFAIEKVAAARRRLGDRLEIIHVLPDYFQKYPKACLHGWASTFLTVSPDGAVLPCQTAREIPELEFPNVRSERLEDAWFGAPAFQKFRGDAWMPEPCRSCDRREIDFGGCRCQAFLLTGDPAATDPVCHLSPLHSTVEDALREAESAQTELEFRVIR